jgi:hypothetical protein
MHEYSYAIQSTRAGIDRNAYMSDKIVETVLHVGPQ